MLLPVIFEYENESEDEHDPGGSREWSQIPRVQTIGSAGAARWRCKAQCVFVGTGTGVTFVFCGFEVEATPSRRFTYEYY